MARNLGYRVWGIGYREKSRKSLNQVNQGSDNKSLALNNPHTPNPIPHTLEFNYGFTLIELLVYMIIMGFIIVVAGRVFSDSTSMRVRSQNMLKSAEVSGKISELLKEDISQMGTKAWGQSSASAYVVNVKNKVYWDDASNDFSSYELIHNSPKENFDHLTFRKAEFDDDGIYVGTRQIKYYVRADSLFRSCETIDNKPDDVCPEEESEVLIGTKLTKFRLNPSKPGMADNLANSDILFPPTSLLNYSLSRRTSGTNVKQSVTISGNASPDPESDAVIEVSSFSAKNTAPEEKDFNQLYLVSSGNAWDECEGMTLAEGETYVVEFDMPFPKPLSSDSKKDINSTQFLPGMDHIAVGFRSKSGEVPHGAPPDVLFYPPQAIEAAGIKRHAEFSVSKKIENACLALTFAFYSPKASSGKVRFKNFNVFRKTDEAFHFPRDLEPDYGTSTSNKDEKAKVKAFELVMEIEHNGEKVKTYSENEDGESKTVEKGMIITTPNNGIKAAPSTP